MKTEEKFTHLSRQVQNEPEKVKEEAEQLLKKGKEKNDHHVMFNSYLLLSDVYSHQGNYQSAEEELKQAMMLAKADNNQQQLPNFQKI